MFCMHVSGPKKSILSEIVECEHRQILNAKRRIKSPANRRTGIHPGVEPQTTVTDKRHRCRKELPPFTKVVSNAHKDTGNTRTAAIGAHGDQAVADTKYDAVNTAIAATSASRSKSAMRRSKSETDIITENKQIVKERTDETEKSVVPLKEKQKRHISINKPARHVIATDAGVNTTVSESASPLYMETNTKIDYGRLVVEPSHGIHPDKKKLLRKKGKVKTKGEANKHLKVATKYAAYDYSYKENFADLDKYEHDYEVDVGGNYHVDNISEERHAAPMAQLSPVIVNAVDQLQILDDREFNLVPEAIKRIDVSKVVIAQW